MARVAEALPILWDVAEEHLEEAAFLWEGWERALHSPRLVPREVRDGIEQRLAAHLHALYLGGPGVAERLLEPALTGQTPSQTSAAAFALLTAGKLRKVLQALHRAKRDQRPAIRRAIELHALPSINKQLMPLASSGVPGVQAAALQVLAFRTFCPGETLLDATKSSDSMVLSAALACARLWPAPRSMSFVAGALGATDPIVRDAAIESGLVLGMREAWQVCRRTFESPDASAQVLLLAALGGGAAERDGLLARLSAGQPSPECLWAAGFTGSVAVADACVEAMWANDGRVARLAGEAFSAITGLRLQGVLVKPEQQAELIAFEDEDLDADLVPTPEDELPLPEAFRVEEWWEKKRPGFNPATSYLGGRPLDVESFRGALEQGAMRRRHALALALEIRSQGALRLGSRRWVGQQQISLDGLRANQLLKPFAELATKG